MKKLAILLLAAMLLLTSASFAVAEDKITLEIGVKAPSSSYQAAWDDLEWVKAIEEASGYDLVFRVFTGDDVNLMFTSRDYPDITFNLGTDKQIMDAALGGDAIPLDDLIAQYSPNWSKYLAENPIAKRTITMEDGHIYSLPMLRDVDVLMGIRDQWLINKSWLDELNLAVPTTIDEFYNCLVAFKENAGKGSIPENVIPYYVYGMINNVGGALDLINSFGVRVVGNDFLVTVSDEGKVEYNFINEAIKEPLLFLRKCFEEGLIPFECLTDKNDTYLVKTRSESPIVGAFHSRQNPDANNTAIVAFGPLDAGNGVTPITRSQRNQSLSKNFYTIYSNCKNPEAAMKLADLIAQPDWSVQGMYGMLGDTYTSKNEDGSYSILPYPADSQGLVSPMNRIPLLISKDVPIVFVDGENASLAQLARAFNEVYSPYTIKLENLYPKASYTTEQTDRLAELKTDLSSCIKNTFANWMLSGGIEEGWDGYISEMNNLGVQEYIDILQQALDTFNGK